MSGPIDSTVPDYAGTLRDFRIEQLASALHGDLEQGLNACVECCDRYADSEAIALRWDSADGRSASVSYAELQALSARFAGLLNAQGIGPGDVVAGLLPRTPELLVTILGTWRAGAVYQPLFTAFGPKAIEQRLQTSEARLVVTDAANRAKLDGLAVAPKVLLVDGEVPEGDLAWAPEMGRQPPVFEPVLRRGSDLFLMMSTSGTSGPPKGVPVPLKALLSMLAYMRFGLDLRPDDRYWNIADPGWAYGLYFAVTGPLLLGQTTTFFDGAFTAENLYRVIRKHGINNLAGAPTAFRLLIAAGAEAAGAVKGRLRVVSSAGEPLNPEVIRWFAEHLDVTVHDHYGQTELGMVICNYHGLRHAVKPGSAGFPIPGYRLVVLDEQGRELPPGEPGVLAADLAQSPLMWFGGYWKRGHSAFDGAYYRSGDAVQRDADGRFSFVGRADDIITSSGYRIGPFDVESALVEHPAVVETAVIGKPDPERTEIVKAFVVLARDVDATDALKEAMRLHVRQRLSAHAYPREIEFVDALPKTPSGKIQRFLLRQLEADRASAGAD